MEKGPLCTLNVHSLRLGVLFIVFFVCVQVGVSGVRLRSEVSEEQETGKSCRQEYKRLRVYIRGIGV